VNRPRPSLEAGEIAMVDLRGGSQPGSEEGFMADDKDGTAPDPWADLDSGEGGDAGDGFSFSFDAVEEQPADEPAAAEGFSLTTDDADLIAADMFAADATKSPGASADDATLDDLASDWLAAAPETSAATGTPADDPAAAISDDDPFAFVTTDRDAAAGAEVEASLAAGSSTVEIGTGESGVVSESDIVTGADSAAGVGEEAEASAVLSSDEEQSQWPMAEGDDGPAGEGEAAGVAEVAATLGGAAAVAAPAPAKRGRTPVKPTRKKPGAIGQLVGVVLGGLMALPITYAILVWGFGKDPFKLTKKIPAELAFLLPEKFQPGFRPAGLPRLDDIAVPEPLAEEPENSAPAEPAVPDPADVAATENAPAEPVEPVVPPQPPEPPAPPPLDVSAVERAVSAAGEAIDAVAAADTADSGRKKLLKNCYLKLVEVGEELAVLEATASDVGRPLAAAPKAVDALYERIGRAEGLFDDLERVCRDWLSYRKRPANGVLLVAKLDDVRKVGPYWSSTASVTMADGSEKKVSVLSRIEPRAAAGDRAVVAGVVFGDDVVWATDCRSVDAVAGGGVF
jgi:hypothetical protein